MGLSVDKREERSCTSNSAEPAICRRPCAQVRFKPWVRSANRPCGSMVLKGVPKPVSTCAGQTEGLSDRLKRQPPQSGASFTSQGWVRQHAACSCIDNPNQAGRNSQLIRDGKLAVATLPAPPVRTICADPDQTVPLASCSCTLPSLAW